MTGGADVAGTVALFVRRHEGELAHHDDVAARAEDVAVHDAGVVVEDAQACYFAAKPLGVVEGVGLLDAEQHQQTARDARLDTPVDGDGGVADTMNDGSHFFFNNKGMGLRV